MTRNLIFICLLFVSVSALADASDGEYLGFKLGERYSMPQGSVGKEHITGALMYAVDPGRRHQHMGSLSLYVSPKTSTIGSIFGGWYFTNERSAKHFLDGYLRSLENKYGSWKRRRSTLTNGEYQMWVDLEQKSPYVDHWPSQKNYRVSVALIFAPDSVPRSDWLARVQREANDLLLTAGN